MNKIQSNFSVITPNSYVKNIGVKFNHIEVKYKKISLDKPDENGFTYKMEKDYDYNVFEYTEAFFKGSHISHMIGQDEQGEIIELMNFPDVKLKPFHGDFSKLPNHSADLIKNVISTKRLKNKLDKLSSEVEKQKVEKQKIEEQKVEKQKIEEQKEIDKGDHK
jgi:hypothetical protein